jgi:hypothetical protein
MASHRGMYARRRNHCHDWSPMTNWDKTKLWFFRTLKYGVGTTLIAVLLGLVVMGATWDNKPDAWVFPLLFGFIGFLIAGAIPSAVCVWFLFLHMLGQTSEAIKGKQ